MGIQGAGGTGGDKGDKSIAEISSEYKVHSTQIAAWKRRVLVGIKDFFVRGARPMGESHEQELANLYAQIGRLKVENDFLKKNQDFCINSTNASCND